MTEHNEQSKLFHQIRLRAQTDKRYRNIYAVPNAQLFPRPESLGITDRKIIAALKTALARIVNYFKSEGLEPGTWDINVDWPSGKWHGLRIEMKYGKGRLSKAQQVWKARYMDAGYAVAVCWSSDEALETITNYFGDEL